MGLVVIGGTVLATVTYFAALLPAVVKRGVRFAAIFFAATLGMLWTRQAVVIRKITDCGLDFAEWLQAILLFSPPREISARHVEPGLMAGFSFRPFFAAAISILSLPTLFLAYREARS